MSLETLKAKILENLSEVKKSVRQSNIDDVNFHPDPIGTRQLEDNHRKAAFAMFDDLLEKGVISPEEAEKKKARWDVMHGY